MPFHSDIPRLARQLHRVLSVLIVALPLVVVGLVARDAAAPALVGERYPGLTITPEGGAVLVAGLLGLLPLAALLYALVEMRRLFARYREGEILTPACAAHIQGIGQGLFALALLGPVTNTLQILALTWNNPPGQRALVVALDGNVLGFALAGALMTLIGWVMRAAAEVADENRGFV